MVHLLIGFRLILVIVDRKNEKFLASCKISCNVNLKHTRIKTGAGAGGVVVALRGLVTFSSFPFQEVSELCRTSLSCLAVHILQGYPSF